MKEDFLCTDEGESDGCLGVEIKAIDDKLTLKQPQLIKREIELLELINVNPISVPVAKQLLGKNAEGKDIDGHSFHHRSATGLLQCLTGCTMPDTSMTARG